MKILYIGDLHLPYCDTKDLEVVYLYAGMIQPDVIIQGGDLLDQYMFSRFDKDMNQLSPELELAKAREMAVEFWNSLKDAAPKAECYQLTGNHDVRILKRTMSSFPEVYGIVEEARKKLYTFDGVTTKFSDRDYLEIEGVIYCHGWQGKLGAHANHFGKSVVRCHSHKASLTMKQDDSTNHQILFEMECGALADEKSVPLSYTASSFTKWKKAVAVVEDGIPRLEVF